MTLKSDQPTFEEALEHLETIIEQMEEGETPLQELVAKFEEGSKLLKHCRQQLKSAELTVEKLNKENGELEAYTESL